MFVWYSRANRFATDTMLRALHWVQGALLEGDDAAAEAHLTSVMQSYCKLFYGHALTDAEIAEPAP